LVACTLLYLLNTQKAYGSGTGADIRDSVDLALEKVLRETDLIHGDLDALLQESTHTNPLQHHKDFSSLQNTKNLSEAEAYDQLAVESERNTFEFGAEQINDDADLYEVVSEDDFQHSKYKPYAVVIRHLEEGEGGRHVFDNDLHQDNEHPLISLMEIQPHSMKIMIKPREFLPKTMVRLLYERVRSSKSPHRHHLDSPVTEFIPLYKSKQVFEIENLPKGKYIVCGESNVDDEIIQTNCFQTIISKLDNNQLQPGVIVLTTISIVIVVAAVLYAIFYNAHNKEKRKRLARTCVAPDPCVHCKETHLNMGS